MDQHPDSPEACALILLEEILEKDDQTKSNLPPAARMLDLFAECLIAVNGDRLIPKEMGSGWLN
jgi:hypothetical protein